MPHDPSSPSLDVSPRTWTADDVIDTQLLEQRPSKPANYKAESLAMLQLAQALSRDPGSIAQRLVDSALRLTKAASAGLSLVEVDDGTELFRWIATAGEYACYLRGTMPRDFSPCGEVLRRGEPLLMRDMKRAYPYVEALHAPPTEVLLVPFEQDGTLVGTVWIVHHAAEHTFDREDLRLIQCLAVFASAVSSTVGLVNTLIERQAQSSRELESSERQRQLLDRLFRQAPGFVALLDGPNYTIAMINDAYQRLVGPRAVVGRPAFETLPELREQGFERLLDHVYRTGRPHLGHDVPFTMIEDGNARETYLDFVFQPVVDANHKVTGILVQGHDMTERRLAVQALVEADRRKDEFLATLSHELRNPVSSIRLAGQVLRFAPDSNPRQLKAIELIERQTGVLASMVGDLQDISSIRAGKINLHLADVDIEEFLLAGIEGAQAWLTQRDHRLTVCIPKQPIRVRGDMRRLSQVIANLLGNAAKYTATGGDIRIDAGADVGFVQIDVIDDGIGIAQDMLPNVFDMFVQAPTADRPSPGGLGIGLALVKQLVELHGGTVTAESEPGRGSRFSVRLPVQATST